MIVFIHIPKTAGIHFQQILAQVYAPEELIRDYGDCPELPASRYNSDPIGWRREADESIRNLPPKARMIFGHFSATKYLDRLPAADLMTWVRHPIPRLISNYFFLKMYDRPFHLHHPILEAARGEVGFAEFAEMPVMQDLMTGVFLRSARIEDFSFIGIQEHFDDDLADLKDMLGWPAFDPPAGNTNANSYPGYREEVRRIMDDRPLIRRIERMNRDDLEFYRDAVELRRRRLRSRGRRWWFPLSPRPVAAAG